MGRPRRPDQTTIDPAMLSRGEVGELTAAYDTYFAPEGSDALEVILEQSVDRLREPDQSCVRMVSMAGMTYDDAAEHLHRELGRRVHRKTVWRWTQRGLDVLRDELVGASWAAILLAGRVPQPSGGVPPTDPNNESDRDIEVIEGGQDGDREDLLG